MPVREEWSPAPSALTTEALAAQGRAAYFLHNDTLYLGFLAPELTPDGQDIWYVAIARDGATPTSFPGSTVVTPVRLTRVTLL